jgi:hypothetical protein
MREYNKKRFDAKTITSIPTSAVDGNLHHWACKYQCSYEKANGNCFSKATWGGDAV